MIWVVGGSLFEFYISVFWVGGESNRVWIIIWRKALFIFIIGVGILLFVKNLFVCWRRRKLGFFWFLVF